MSRRTGGRLDRSNITRSGENQTKINCHSLLILKTAKSGTIAQKNQRSRKRHRVTSASRLRAVYLGEAVPLPKLLPAGRLWRGEVTMREDEVDWQYSASPNKILDKISYRKFLLFFLGWLYCGLWPSFNFVPFGCCQYLRHFRSTASRFLWIELPSLCQCDGKCQRKWWVYLGHHSYNSNFSPASN